MTLSNEDIFGDRLDVQVLGRRWPVAAKEHRCEQCGGVIERQHRYRRTFMLIDGEPYTERVHLAGCDEP